MVYKSKYWIFERNKGVRTSIQAGTFKGIF